MRIVVVNNFFPPRVGGSAHLSESLAIGCAAAGNEVMVLTAEYRDAPAEEERDGIHIVRLPAWTMPKLGTAVDFEITFAAGPRNLHRVFRLLDGFAPDVIHLHGQFLDLSWMVSWYARRRNKPVMLSVHTRLESTHRGYDRLFRCLDAALVRPLVSLSRPTYVVMDTLMGEYIEARYRPGPGRTIAIPVGVHTERNRVIDREEARAELGFADEPLILSVGHVIPLRDRLALVGALPRVLARFPQAKLVVVGEVHYPAFLEEARRRGVEHCIVCTGAVDRTTVAKYLAAADVETHDLQGLGLGTASLEAMFAGVPVVAAVRADNFPGIELRSGTNITLVPVGDTVALADAICGLLTDRTVAAQISLGQRQLIESHFAMGAVIARHLTELQRLVDGATIGLRPSAGVPADTTSNEQEDYR